MKKKNNKGFSLLEVLIALVVLSIGMLGLAGLQLVGLRSNNSAGFRSQATAFAADMAERMRANPSAVNSYGVDVNGDGAINAADYPFGNVDSDNFNCNNAPPAACSDFDGGNAVACNAANMASFDIDAVACGELHGGVRMGGVQRQLPNGRLTIACIGGVPCANGANYNLSVFWDEVQRDGTTLERSVAMTIQP